MYTKAQIKEKDNESFTAIASSEAEDRHGEVVEVKGWDLKNFKNNPILLFMHDHMKPIGKATRIWVDKSGSKPLLKFKGVISDATEYGRAAKQLMAEDILKTFSVGFRPLEMEGNRIQKSELFEISLVSVPANPEARLLAAKSLEGFDDAVVKEFTEEKDETIARLQSELQKTNEIAEKALAQSELAVKALKYVAPHQRSNKSTTMKRLNMSKVIAKTGEKLITKQLPRKQAVDLVKVMKRSSEMLIRDLKGDL